MQPCNGVLGDAEKRICIIVTSQPNSVNIWNKSRQLHLKWQRWKQRQIAFGVELGVNCLAYIQKMEEIALDN